MAKLFLREYVIEIAGANSLATESSVSRLLNPGCAPTQAVFFYPCQSYRCVWTRTAPQVVQAELKT